MRDVTVRPSRAWDDGVIVQEVGLPDGSVWVCGVGVRSGVTWLSLADIAALLCAEDEEGWSEEPGV